ncbi:MAG: cell wall hydrolase/autolysin [Candidatus Gottesmanbacteria bacterium GW2011_GWA2_43_14]|uniref:Cell wall hydrolase/autolysin n=1 Tax=Candidatus Gottesmanbacteria bacterium GW2011_GWA2_43_14 TaxID=1618443 RepID=A0A0G1GBP0_9BACT|nr:MAG: cell wall hydrolase/autolysin [Candidatus Gottesmanbacteria bacterium GW2011_GWA2_43_14]
MIGDLSGKAAKQAISIEKKYQIVTKFVKDKNISRNMTGYYVFAWWRYDHAVHPKTPSVILETGFLSSPADRKIIVGNPGLPAAGLAAGMVEFLQSENLLTD